MTISSSISSSISFIAVSRASDALFNIAGLSDRCKRYSAAETACDCSRYGDSVDRPEEPSSLAVLVFDCDGSSMLVLVGVAELSAMDDVLPLGVEEEVSEGVKDKVLELPLVEVRDVATLLRYE